MKKFMLGIVAATMGLMVSVAMANAPNSVVAKANPQTKELVILDKVSSDVQNAEIDDLQTATSEVLDFSLIQRAKTIDDSAYGEKLFGSGGATASVQSAYCLQAQLLIDNSCAFNANTANYQTSANSSPGLGVPAGVASVTLMVA